jgi:tetratricopeptide (TPR) repeat protein
VTPLEVGQNEPSLWVAHSYGMRDFMTEQQHFVAIYSYNDGNWQELGKIEMDDADYVDETSVQQVMLEPDNIWLELHAGVGAHSGTYHLFQFNGEDLKIALSGFSPSPGVGNTTDLNGDGTLEVILDTTDPYVFCYACGVWQPGAQVWQWDGHELVEVTLALLPDTASADLREANNRAVTLAEAGLWQDAQLAIDEAVAFDPANNIVNWNNILITMQTEALLDHVKNGAYPLLAYVFYGDYAAALDLMRPYPVEEIFGPQSPLVVETPASGWEDALRERIVGATTGALEVQPDLAAAYFLRAWAAYLVNPDDAQIVADIEKAVQLDPAESLFADSLTYLKQ